MGSPRSLSEGSDSSSSDSEKRYQTKKGRHRRHGKKDREERSSHHHSRRRSKSTEHSKDDRRHGSSRDSHRRREKRRHHTDKHENESKITQKNRDRSRKNTSPEQEDKKKRTLNKEDIEKQDINDESKTKSNDKEIENEDKKDQKSDQSQKKKDDISKEKIKGNKEDMEETEKKLSSKHRHSKCKSEEDALKDRKTHSEGETIENINILEGSEDELQKMKAMLQRELEIEEELVRQESSSQDQELTTEGEDPKNVSGIGSSSKVIKKGRSVPNEKLGKKVKSVSGEESDLSAWHDGELIDSSYARKQQPKTSDTYWNKYADKLGIRIDDPEDNSKIKSSKQNAESPKIDNIDNRIKKKGGSPAESPNIDNIDNRIKKKGGSPAESPKIDNSSEVDLRHSQKKAEKLATDDHKTKRKTETAESDSPQKQKKDNENESRMKRKTENSESESNKKRKAIDLEGHDVPKRKKEELKDEETSSRKPLSETSENKEPVASSIKKPAVSSIKKPAASSIKKPVLDPLSSRTGGAYIPPARLKLMQEEITDKSSVAYQRLAWEALKKSINGLVNKVNVSNIGIIVRELFKENIIRGRGVLCRALMQAQAFSPTFTHVYTAMAAIINTKFPQIGELLLHRLVIQLRKGVKRNDKNSCMASCRFIAHLINQQVAHEVVALEILTMLLEKAKDITDETDVGDKSRKASVELAISFLKECGMKLGELAPKGLMIVMETLRHILHEGKLDARFQYMVEVLMAIKKGGFKDFPAVVEELDLVEEDDQFTHVIEMDGKFDGKDILNVFKHDPDYEENDKKYKELKASILGESEDESGEEGSGSESDEEDEEDEEEVHKDEEGNVILDRTETNLVSFRRTVYLTIQSSLDVDECAHKLLKGEIKPGWEEELCNMIIDCCAQQRTYMKFYGLLAQRFCMLNKIYREAFEKIFIDAYETCHRLEIEKLRNVSKLFAHLLVSDALSWEVMCCVHLNQDETTSSSRVFLKILFEELANFMGLCKLNERLRDRTLASSFEGILPRNNPVNTRFSINFFTTIGLGGLTDDLREFLRSQPKPTAVIAPVPQTSKGGSSGSSDGSSSSDGSKSTSSSSSSSSESSSDSSSSGSSSTSSGTSSSSSSSSDSVESDSSSSDDSSVDSNAKIRNKKLLKKLQIEDKKAKKKKDEIKKRKYDKETSKGDEKRHRDKNKDNKRDHYDKKRDKDRRSVERGDKKVDDERRKRDEEERKSRREERGQARKERRERSNSGSDKGSEKESRKKERNKEKDKGRREKESSSDKEDRRRNRKNSPEREKNRKNSQERDKNRKNSQERDKNRKNSSERDKNRKNSPEREKNRKNSPEREKKKRSRKADDEDRRGKRDKEGRAKTASFQNDSRRSRLSQA